MNQLPTLKKNKFFISIIYKIKNFFYNEKNIKNTSNATISSNLKNNIKVRVNTQIIILKNKLENGEIKAIDLTDSQIDELQKIYDEEIHVKQQILDKLKKRVINPPFSHIN